MSIVHLIMDKVSVPPHEWRKMQRSKRRKNSKKDEKKTQRRSFKELDDRDEAEEEIRTHIR